MKQSPETHIVGEVEFELNKSGHLVVSSSIASTIITHLSKKDVENAATLYQSAPAGTNKKLIEEARTSSASLRERLMDMFALARDFPAAAAVAQMVNNPQKAADFYESAYMFDEAAVLYEKAGSLEKAALLLEKSLKHTRAAELFLRCHNYGRALTNLQKTGRYIEAGKVCIKLKKWGEAVELFSQALDSDETEMEAAMLLAELFERAGNKRESMEYCLRICKKKRPSEESLEAYIRLTKLLIEQQAYKEAEQALAPAIKTFPDHKSLIKLRRALESTSTQSYDRPDIDTNPDNVVLVDDVLGFLQKLPIFSLLSMEEIKALRDISVPAKAKAGEAILKQGEEGKGLYVICSGEVVIKVGTGQAAMVVADLGPRAYFGEVSLVDDAPASATVEARTDVELILVTKNDFRDFLYTNDKIAARFYKTFSGMLASRLRGANEMIERASMLPPEQR